MSSNDVPYPNENISTDSALKMNSAWDSLIYGVLSSLTYLRHRYNYCSLCPLHFNIFLSLLEYSHQHVSCHYFWSYFCKYSERVVYTFFPSVSSHSPCPDQSSKTAYFKITSDLDVDKSRNQS